MSATEGKYEGFTREELINYIEICQEFFNKNSIPDNEHGALYSVYGRLIKYAEQKNAELAALRERVKVLEAVLKDIATMKHYKLKIGETIHEAYVRCCMTAEAALRGES